MKQTHDEETVDLVAKAINGPHDAKHIGEEKLRELQEYRWLNHSNNAERNIRRNEARAILAAMPEIVGAMVKPLDWDDMDEIDPWDTYSCNNGYDIQLDGDGAFTLFRNLGGCVGVEFKTLEEAKQAANDHHRAQVLGALGL